jgi:chromosome segregation protein
MAWGGKKRLVGWGLMLVLILMIAGMVMAYSTYENLEASLQELQAVYAKEQAKNKRLAREVQNLTRTVEQAKARENDMSQASKISRDEKNQLELKASKLETAVKRWQIAYTSENEKTEKLSQTARELLNVMEQAQTQIKALNQSLKAANEEKDRLESEAMRLKTTVRQLQTTYGTEEAKNRELVKQVSDLEDKVDDAQERVHSLEQAEKGRVMMIDKEREWQEKAKNWGTGYRKAFERIFF